MDFVDQRLIGLLQGDMPLEEDPYAAIGRQLDISAEEVVRRLKMFHKTGQLKRIGGILRHQKSGYTENAMAVFQVAAENMDETAMELAQSPLVSHCYQRSTHEVWPYNLYAMLHSRSADEIRGFIDDFALSQDISAYDILHSLEELKKSSMTYF